MSAVKYIGCLFGVILASCYYFPFELAAFPGVNSKMLMALVGLVILIFDGINKKFKEIDYGLIQLGLWALALSFVAFFACAVNNTHDYSFTTYIVSMSVWLCGAYCFVRYINYLYGDVDVQKVATYLSLACVMQCSLALLFNYYPELDQWSNQFFGGEAYMGVDAGERLHGIGCALDVAGFRFAAVLIMLMFLMYFKSKEHNNLMLFIYAAMFVFIAVIGNMISRSTTIGLSLSFVCLLLMGLKDSAGAKLLGKVTLLIVIIIPAIVVLYNSNEVFREDIRFGFEGFFSLVENGEWQTTSNDILKEMVVWPDNLQSWIIGDGYAANPTDKSIPSYDPYYLGPSFVGYYMNTDIGYCRFVLYFGLIGLAVFSAVLIQSAWICIKRFPDYKWMFAFILLLNFIGWIKVSTDLFMVFAPFICISRKEN